MPIIEATMPMAARHKGSITTPMVPMPPAKSLNSGNPISTAPSTIALIIEPT